MRLSLVFLMVCMIFLSSCNKNTFVVSEKYQQCDTHDDCVMVPSSCTECDCGTPINKKFSESYMKTFLEGCERTNLPDCTQEYCTYEGLKCVGNVCTYYKEVVKEDEIDACELDDDCIIVPYSHCCGMTKRTINRDFLDLYEVSPEWQGFHDEDACAVIGLCSDDSNVDETRCEETGFGKRCVLIY